MAGIKEWRYFLRPIFLFVYLSVASGSAYAISFSVSPSTSTNGSFQVSYSSNSRFYVFMVELNSDGTSTIISSEGGAPSSGSMLVTKSNGTYGYRLRLCDSQTLGYAGNCAYTTVKSVQVNRTSSGGAVDLGYQYDELGRLTLVSANGTTKSGYCYDEAGNRTVVTDSSQITDPCDLYEEEVIPPPGSLNYYTHTGGGYTITWSVVPGATHYNLKLSNEQYPVIHDIYQTTYYTSGPNEAPVWIQACSATSCSSKAYF